MFKMPGLRSPDKASGERRRYQGQSWPLPPPRHRRAGGSQINQALGLAVLPNLACCFFCLLTAICGGR